MCPGQPCAPAPPAIFGPAFGIGFVQVLDGERFMIEREPQLLRNEAEPAAEVIPNRREREIAPAFVLLDLPGDDGAAVGRTERLEAARRARERADGEVPTAVRRNECAAVHHAAIAERPRKYGVERAGGRDGTC